MCRFYLITTLILLFSLLFSFGTQAQDISAKGAVLIETQSMSVAYEKNANQRMPMASTTKIMSALVTLENSCLDDYVLITKEMTGIEGSSIYLQENEKLTVSDLLYALMLESANDAAVALAIHVGGSIEGFVKLMNDKARELGLKDTNFTNPHGLDDNEHYTTPYELGVITSNAMKNQVFKTLVSTTKKAIPNSNSNGTRILINHNKLLRSYDGAIGVKTGFTKRCGRCLVSCAEKDGVSLVAVTLNAPNDWNDHKLMLDYGFSQFKNIELANASDYQIVLNAINGTKSHFIAENTEDLNITLRKNNINISAVLEANRLLPAPVKKGQMVGKIVFYNNGEEITSLPLYATESISNINYKKSFFERILKQ